MAVKQKLEEDGNDYVANRYSEMSVREGIYGYGRAASGILLSEQIYPDFKNDVSK